MNVNIRIMTLFLAIGLISSCDSYSNTSNMQTAENLQLITPAAGYQPQTFKDYLAIEYSNLADYEKNVVYDYKAAKHFNKKVKKLQAGILVLPDDPSRKNLTLEYKAELTLAREQLLSTIEKYASPENRAALALAQTRYDCWLDQAKSWPNTPERLTCKAQFKENMAMIYRPEVQKFENFDFDRI